ncbi:MAG TPA: formate dehydrogenase subunit alpha [Pyrinomonadaceae bacterium]|nr:formate dehydrogenase subunit alpha [Pyrinomonadaceae bacterium]
MKVSINGRQYHFEQGISVLDACSSAGIAIPTLCHDERLKPIGSCRMCLVEIEGQSRLVPACTTLLTDGMSILTHTPALENERGMILRMLARDHPDGTLQQTSKKPFYQQAAQYGLSESDFDRPGEPRLVDDSHPYIQVDMSKCINCYRCVRICEELQGQFVWQILNRGHETRIVPDSGTTLGESSCVGCGACVDTCPSGALEDKSILDNGKPSNWTRTTCPYCGTGCELNVGTHQHHIVSIKPVLDAPVNHGHLCVKGRYAFDFVDAADRITSPMIRTDDGWRPLSWDDAISYTATRLQQIATEHGPNSIGVLGSARATNEENYLTQKFARVVIGTNNVDCCARVCHTPTAAAMKLMLGTGAATNSYADIEKAQTILVCGANATANHPIVGARIKQAALKGAKLIVIDPRQIELARYATVHLQPRPGTNIPLLNALACAIVEEQLVDYQFIAERVAEWEEFAEFITQFSPEQAAGVCGVEASLIRQAARIYATAKPAICFHGLGVTEHTQGTEGVMCLVNLALLTGNLGKSGAGINPLRGQNNVQGAAHMGCDPGILTGSVSLRDARLRFENVWHAPVPETHGLNLLEMMDAAEAGELKALWTIGYDIALTNANFTATERALKSLDFIVVQDMFLNETARRFGSVFLPATSSFEKDGTFMNAERRVQRVRKAIEPAGDSKPDWKIICELAAAMGKGQFFQYRSVEDIWNEIRMVWPAGYGITYKRIETKGLQWPCPDEHHPGTEVMHVENFPVGKKVALRRISYRPTEEKVDEEFPFLLMTGRTLQQFNAGTMTMRTRNKKLRPTDVLEMSPGDADKLQLHKGDRVLVQSRYGSASMPLRITRRVKPGELFATFHDAAVFLNRVTSPHRDRYVKSPEYKVTAVKVARSEDRVPF